MIFSICCISTSLFAQNGLVFDSAVFIRLSGQTSGSPDFVARKDLVIEPGHVVKITSTSVNIIEGISDLPEPIDNSDQGAIFLQGVLISTVPEASSRGVAFPIWLGPGKYQLGLKTNSARLSNEVMGFVSGVTYKLENHPGQEEED